MFPIPRGRHGTPQLDGHPSGGNSPQLSPFALAREPVVPATRSILRLLRPANPTPVPGGAGLTFLAIPSPSRWAAGTENLKRKNVDLKGESVLYRVKIKGLKHAIAVLGLKLCFSDGQEIPSQVRNEDFRAPPHFSLAIVAYILFRYGTDYGDSIGTMMCLSESFLLIIWNIAVHE